MDLALFVPACTQPERINVPSSAINLAGLSSLFQFGSAARIATQLYSCFSPVRDELLETGFWSHLTDRIIIAPAETGKLV